MTNARLFEVVQARIKEHGGLRKAAKAIGISAPYLCRLRQGEHRPSEVTLKKLGAERQETYSEVEK